MIYTDPAPTLEDVWRLFRETDLRFQESAQRMEKLSEETDRRFRETEQLIENMGKETDRRFQETDRRFQETERQFQETDRKFQEIARQFQETDRRIQESEKRMEKLNQETNKKIGALGGRIGNFVEGILAPGIEHLFQERGIEVTGTSRKVKKMNAALGLEMEIDLLVTNGDCCVLIEVKSSLSVEDVKEHLERMDKFKPLFPEHKGKKIYGAVAGMVIEEGADKFAWRKGFFVITQRGDSAVILNDNKFRPHAW